MTAASTHTIPQEPADYLETLLQLGRLLNSSLDLRHVLDTAIEQVIAFVGAERGFILLVNVETGKVWGEAVRNIERSALEDTLSDRDENNRAEISRTLVEHVLEFREPVLSHNAMEDPRFAARSSVQLSHLRSVLCVPLIAQSRLLGIIYLDNRLQEGMFTDRHMSMLAAFANLAAVAIENARLYDNLRRSLEERLRLQDELHQQETKRLALEEAGRMKTDFVSFVAHELRNPLTTIRGYVQTLLADDAHTISREMECEFYTAIEADSDRLLDLINEMLDVSRLEAGRPLQLRLAPVAIRPLLDKLTRRHRYYKYFTGAHQIVSLFAHDLPETIVADDDKLTQIVSNLLSNAVKYSPEGGQIAVTAEMDGDDGIAIHVRDSGIGLTEEQCTRLFRRYERIERESTRTIPGTGLGLYLVKHLTELHGGTVSATSVPGEGSTFTVRLPLKPPQKSSTPPAP